MSLARAVDVPVDGARARGARAGALVGCRNVGALRGGSGRDGDRVGVAGGSAVAAVDRVAYLRRNWEYRRDPGLDQSAAGTGNGGMGADAPRYYQPPRRPSITAGVSSMILRSSNAERWRMYCRS